jgi:hypothetical protein
MLERVPLQNPPWLAPAEQVDHRCAERVRIGRRIDDAGQLLDRHVTEGADS